MPRLSQRRYAARIGVSHVYINRLVRQGKLPADSEGRLDAEEADRVMEALAQPARPSRRRAPGERREGGLAPVAAGDDEVTPPEVSAMPAAAGDLPTLLLRTRLKSEVERAKLLEIKAKVETGKYVDADDVRVAAFNKARTVRDNLLNVPSRLAPLMAAESSERECFRLMDTEIRRALEELTGGAREE